MIAIKKILTLIFTLCLFTSMVYADAEEDLEDVTLTTYVNNSCAVDYVFKSTDNPVKPPKSVICYRNGNVWKVTPAQITKSVIKDTANGRKTYTFDGWYATANCDGKRYDSGKMTTDINPAIRNGKYCITLYGKWTSKTEKLNQTITGTGSYSKYVNESFTLDAKAKTDLYYTSNTPSICTVTKTGKVTAVKAGTGTITIKAVPSAKYKEASKTVTVKVANKPQKTQSITVSKRTYWKSTKSNAFNLGAKAKTPLIYSSSNTKIATVSNSGVVKVVGGGTATINIRARENETYKAANTSVTINAYSYSGKNHYIAHARSNLDGKAGDSSGKEVLVSKWLYKSSSSSYYNWTYVFRIKDEEQALKAAYMMERVCANNYIGYCSNGTKTYGKNALQKLAPKYGYDMSKIKIKTGASCGDVVCLSCRYAGIKCDYIGSAVPLAKHLKNNSAFKCYSSADYRTKTKNLRKGDILITAHSNGKNNHVDVCRAKIMLLDIFGK